MAELANLMQLSRQSLYDIAAGKQSITPYVALRIAKLTGTTPHEWLDLQRDYDVKLAGKQLAAVIKAIPTLEERW
jgi:addiction module HigA family antidote